jgi:drug/metabolite transporter (DMT)-like permease
VSVIRPNDHSPIWIHYLWMHLIVFIWGFTGILGKLITIEALPIVWYRVSLATVFMGLFFQFQKRPFIFPSKSLFFLLFLNSAIIVLHWITFYHTIKISNVSLTLACLSTGPFFVSILEPIFFKRKIYISEILLGLGIVIGMLILIESVEGNDIAIALGLISALLSALFSVLNGRIVNKMKPLDISIWEMGIGAFILGVYFALNGSLIQVISSPTPNDWIYLMILASLCTSFAFVQSVRIMKYLSPFTVVLTIAMEPVYGIILAIIIFGATETMNPMFYIGVSTILTVISLDAYLKRRKRKRDNYLYHTNKKS